MDLVIDDLQTINNVNLPQFSYLHKAHLMMTQIIYVSRLCPECIHQDMAKAICCNKDK